MARILVAEDESDIRALIALRLRRAGHDVTEADDGESALQLAIDENPDVLVLDWMMPGKTGIEVCEALRHHPHVKSARVLMLTARAHENDIATAYAAGVDDFLVKPFRPIQLEERIAALLARR
ncbi:MAG: response regulator [Micrococcales bacterium 32-70-13]|nr:MAG: response regulator [Micrococcales bacterium 32-70-13]